jgi:hypothetical protein
MLVLSGVCNTRILDTMNRCSRWNGHIEYIETTAYGVYHLTCFYWRCDFTPPVIFRWRILILLVFTKLLFAMQIVKQVSRAIAQEREHLISFPEGDLRRGTHRLLLAQLMGHMFINIIFLNSPTYYYRCRSAVHSSYSLRGFMAHGIWALNRGVSITICLNIWMLLNERWKLRNFASNFIGESNCG